MGYVGCYSLVLYCDHPECSEFGRHSDYEGCNFGQCVRDARHDGWVINRRAKLDNMHTGKALCPKHSGKRIATGRLEGE